MAPKESIKRELRLDQLGREKEWRRDCRYLRREMDKNLLNGIF